MAVLTLSAAVPRPGGFDELLTLFKEWRAFQKPPVAAGIPDYSAAAMSAQHRALAAWQRRLAGLDTTGWTVPQRVDYHLVRAEMNGLDFDHRVLRPWVRDPAFYVTVFGSQSDQPAREGPHAEGSIELWTYQFPLSADRAALLTTQLRIVPGLLEQARKNLTGNARDLWTASYRDFADQDEELEKLSSRVAGSPALDSAVQAARGATASFVAWLKRQEAQKTGPSGIGVENYDWYLKNVKLLPYTWHDQVTLMRRELGRATAALALEESRNRKLPPLEPVASQADWERRYDAAVTEYMAFLRDQQIVTLKPYMEPALRAKAGRFRPGPREFFNEVNYRDPIVMRTHDYHWIELAIMANDPNPDPVRRGPLLYNIFDARTEGLATALEEMMMHAGFLDTHPRSRELIYVLIGQRAARALGDLMMHGNQASLAQAAAFAVANTPRGWLRANAGTVWGEQHLYLQQPAYGTSYLVGKQELETLLGEFARSEGAAFTMSRFMDRLNAIGLIPVSLTRWEMLGHAGPPIAPASR
jgi:hypothetical protein